MSPEKPAPINHLRGTRSLSGDGYPVITVKPSSGITSLKSVEIHYCLMEIPVAAAIAALPPSLHPSAPGQVTATFYRVPDSPVGAFELAVIGVACRAGIRPRMLTMRAYASTATAATFLRDGWGYACDAASVHTTSGYHGLDSVLTVDGVTALALSTRALEPVAGAGAAIKYCSPLNPVRFRDKSYLLQVDIGYAFHKTERGLLQIDGFDGALLGLPADKPEFVICGTRASVDIELHPQRTLLDIERLPDYGGILKLAAA